MRQAGFEPALCSSEGAASYRLGYWRRGREEMDGARTTTGPGTSRLQGGCSDRLSYTGKRRARGVLPCRARHRRAGPEISPGAGCVSRTRDIRVTRAALCRLSCRRKWTKGQRRRFRNQATLQQGLPLRAERAPLANSGRSRCQTAKLPRSPKRCVSTQRKSYARNFHADRVTRAASPSIAATPIRARPNADDARGVKAKPCVRELCRAIRSLLPVRRRGWPAAG